MPQVPRPLSPHQSLRHFFGAELRTWRERRGLSQAALGALVLHSGAEIGKIEKAERWPSKDLAARCDEALEAAGALLRLWPLVGTERQRLTPVPDLVPAELSGMADRLVPLPGSGLQQDATGEGDQDTQVVSWLRRRDFLTTVTALAFTAPEAGSLHDRLNVLARDIRVDAPRRLGLADVERIEATTKAFREWDNQWGGGLPRPAVLAQLRWVIAAGKNAVITAEATRARLLTATADLATVAAWTHYDIEGHDEARRLWLVAIDAAREAGNAGLVSHVLRQLAHQALHLDRPEEGLRLSRLAHATAADPGDSAADLATVQAASYEAWCYAVMGKTQSCERALGRAEDHFAVGADVDEPPPWLGYFDQTEFMGLRGHIYHVLADTVPAAAAKAVPLLQQAVADRSAIYARTKTLNLIALAAVYFQGGEEVGEGVRIGHEALAGTAALTSPRSRSRLRVLERAARPYTKEPGVADLRQHLRTAIHEAA
ncbi:MAG: helix-turn-helix domain-containing protein [Micromonosporaceae bacterium]|nr:helix-turn-helix domain-containing protein [Micromonosporaceae bacterium]